VVCYRSREMQWWGWFSVDLGSGFLTGLTVYKVLDSL